MSWLLEEGIWLSEAELDAFYATQDKQNQPTPINKPPPAQLPEYTYLCKWQAGLVAYIDRESAGANLSNQSTDLSLLKKISDAMLDRMGELETLGVRSRL